jgi:hypothetical protein
MYLRAHNLMAQEFLPAVAPQSYYVVGSALPDLLPLASPRHRFRLTSLDHAPATSPTAQAIATGVTAHLRTDAAFHKTSSFEHCQSAVGQLVTNAGFEGIRVRRFFLAHVLTELALDAVLLRRDPALADEFYRSFTAADTRIVTDWTETAIGAPLPYLPSVLRRFAISRYLAHYADAEGVAEGMDRLCARARQDTFTGENRQRLVRLTTQTVSLLTDYANTLLSETAEAVTTEK